MPLHGSILRFGLRENLCVRYWLDKARAGPDLERIRPIRPNAVTASTRAVKINQIEKDVNREWDEYAE